MRNIELRLENGTLIQKCRISKSKKRYLVGRAPTSDVVIDDSHIASSHLEISIQDDELFIQDLDSKSGSILNNQKLFPGKAAALAPLDKIVLADRYFLSITDDKLETLSMHSMPIGIGDIVKSNVSFFETLLTSLSGRLKGIVGTHEVELEKIMDYFGNTIIQRIKELATIHEMSIRMNQIHDFTLLLDTILGMALKVSRADGGAVLIYNEEKSSLTVLVNKSLKTFSPGELTYALAEQAFRRNEIVLVSDSKHSKNPSRKAEDQGAGMKSSISVPLEIQGEMLGVIYLENRSQEHCFTEQNLDFMKALAAHASVTIHNARTFLQAVTDGMTNLFNNKYFRLRLSEEIRRASRHGKPLSLIMCDIDHFKKFNDTYGHQTGDLVIKSVANAIRATVRICDVSARYGGEEFAVILPETDREGAVYLAERLRENIQALTVPHDGMFLTVTSSFGVVSIVAKNQGREEMIRLADKALYQSKKSGRNCVSISSDDD